MWKQVSASIGWQVMGAVLLCGLSAIASPPAVVPDPTFKHRGNNFWSDETSASMSDFGQVHRKNAFYAFSRFNVPEGGVSINESGNIVNMIVRVTGKERSIFQGILTASSSADHTNLYLINPAGFLFKPGADVQVTGHLVVTTADRLRFADGKVISSIPAANEVLSTKAPVAFGFLGGRAAARISVAGEANGAVITLRSGLNATVPGEGSAVSLIGGAIDVAGATLNGSYGRVNLIATGDLKTETEIGLAGRTLSMPVISKATPISGDISLSQAAAIQAQDGSIVVRGGNLTMSQGASLAASSIAVGGGIDIDVSGKMGLDGSDSTSPMIDIGPGFAPPSYTQAGRIDLAAREIRVSNGAQIAALGVDQSPAGDVHLRAKSVVLEKLGLVDVSTSGSGSAGQIDIRHTGSLLIKGVGNAGPEDSGTGLFAGSSSSSSDAGASGSIYLGVDRLTLKFAGSISTNTLGAASGGTVEVHAAHILFDGFGGDQPGVAGRAKRLTGIEARAERDAAASAKGGSITVTAGQIDLVNGGVISASTFGKGQGGDVLVTAHDGIHIEAPRRTKGASPFTGILARSDALRGRPTGGGTLGQSGKVTVKVEDGDLTLIGRGARISTRSIDPGVAAGNVTVNVNGSIHLERDGADPKKLGVQKALSPSSDDPTDQGGISALSMSDAVNVTITASGPVSLQNAIINAQAVKSKQAKVTIDAPVLSLNNSFINGLTTEDQKNVLVSVSGPVLRSVGSDILTNQRDFTFDLNIAQVVGRLDTPYRAPEAILREICGQRVGGSVTSFIVGGSGATPREPGGLDFDLTLPPAR